MSTQHLNWGPRDRSGDAVMDDNGNKMPSLKFVDQPEKPNEPYVFHIRRIVDGKASGWTE